MACIHAQLIRCKQLHTDVHRVLFSDSTSILLTNLSCTELCTVTFLVCLFVNVSYLLVGQIVGQAI